VQSKSKRPEPLIPLFFVGLAGALLMVLAILVIGWGAALSAAPSATYPFGVLIAGQIMLAVSVFLTLGGWGAGAFILLSQPIEGSATESSAMAEAA
jgi:hypothetical protein